VLVAVLTLAERVLAAGYATMLATDSNRSRLFADSAATFLATNAPVNLPTRHLAVHRATEIIAHLLLGQRTFIPTEFSALQTVVERVPGATSASLIARTPTAMGTGTIHRAGVGVAVLTHVQCGAGCAAVLWPAQNRPGVDGIQDPTDACVAVADGIQV
jgi:hypothetical protein